MRTNLSSHRTGHSWDIPGTSPGHPLLLAHMLYTKSRLAIRVLNYCRPIQNAEHLNDIAHTTALVSHNVQ